MCFTFVATVGNLCNICLMFYRSVNQAVTPSSLEREVRGSNLGSVKLDTVLPTARHRWDSSSKGTVLLGCNYVEMSTAKSLHVRLGALQWVSKVESSMTHFEVLGLGFEGQVLGLEASSQRKLACPRLEDSTIFCTVEILLENARNLAKNLRRPFLFSAIGDRLKKLFVMIINGQQWKQICYR